MNETKKLSSFSVGDVGKVLTLPLEENIRNKLLNIGLTVGTTVECIGESPLGDPKAFLVRGGVIALRQEDCLKIEVE